MANASQQLTVCEAWCWAATDVLVVSEREHDNPDGPHTLESRRDAEPVCQRAFTRNAFQ